VLTNTRAGYVEECPNVGQLLANLTFTLAMENEVMAAILDDGEEPEDAAKAWLQANPEVLDAWLDGVTTLDGAEGLPRCGRTSGSERCCSGPGPWLPWWWSAFSSC
jgi:glycine betaine/proline transport system substrate-binding protein